MSEIKRIHNVTQHDVTMEIAGKTVTYKHVGVNYTLVEKTIIKRYTPYNIPIEEKVYSIGHELPKEDGLIYIVSAVVANHCKREDFVYPKTRRDSKGKRLNSTKFVCIREGE